MRDVIFRGKSTVSNKWLYGNLVKTNMNRYFIFPVEISKQDGHHLNIDSDDCFFVNEETIGQYTGLNDQRGMPVFSDDIIKYEDVTEYCDKIERKIVRLLVTDENYWLLPIKKSKVIGNFYDNPEKLEG